MSMSDWTGVVVGIATIYFLWQQNHIFRRQNEIFAAQAGGATMSPETPKARLKRYWPMLAMAAMMLLTWGAIGYDYYDRHGNERAFSDTARFETIRNRTFDGETVVLDGKTFTHCTFKNVEFVYHGRQGFQMTYITFVTSPVMIRTDNRAAFMLMTWIGKVDQENGGHTHWSISLVDKEGNIVNK